MKGPLTELGWLGEQGWWDAQKSQAEETMSLEPGGSWSHAERLPRRSCSFGWTSLCLTGSTEAASLSYHPQSPARDPLATPNWQSGARVSKWCIPREIAAQAQRRSEAGTEWISAKGQMGNNLHGSCHFLNLSMKTKSLPPLIQWPEYLEGKQNPEF